MLKDLLAFGERNTPVALPRGRIGLHALPTAAGLETRDRPDYVWNGQARGNTPFVILQHCVAGRGRLDYDGQRHIIHPGQTMLVRIPHNHSYFVAKDESWTFFFLVLAGREVVSLADQYLQAVGPITQLTEAAIDQLATCCLELLQSTPTAGQASQIAYRAMMVLVDHVSERSGTQSNWSEAVLDHIAGNLSKPLQVEKLAEIARMSRAHFVREFTREFGVPPSEFVFQRRMERAAQLLEVFELSITDVAAQCGFQSANYFAKAFRRAYDVSPSEFRDSGMFVLRGR